MRKLLHGVALIMLFLFMATGTFAQGKGAGVVNTHGRLQVYGNKVCSESGTQISLGGMSFFWSNWDPGYYNAGTVNYLVDDFQASIVRAAAGVAHTPEENGHTSTVASGGVLDNNFDGTVAQVEAVVEAAIANNVYVLIDWHIEGKAAKEGWWVEEARRFFTHFASKYGNYPHVLYEVYNEPAHDGNTTSDIAWFCQEIVNTIRTHDSDNLIICGSADWSQNPQSYTINDNNIAYTFHAYPDAAYGGSHMEAFYRNVPAAMDAGKAVFVTEYGAQYGTHTRTDEFIAQCQEWGISMCAWSVNNKPEAWSIFSGSGTGSLTAIGSYYREKLRAWPTTGPCTDCPDACDDAPAKQVETRIEAEDYCDAGEIQTDVCTSGESYVGWINDLDWMVYKVNVPTAGEYTVTYSVASIDGGTVQFEKQGGTPVYGSVAIPSNGDWCSYTTVSHKVNLEAGEQNLAISAPAGGWNIDWFEISGGGDECVAVNIPAKIEAEAYCDESGTDLEDCDEGGQNVGWINAGDWLKYRINVPSSGQYAVSYRVASLNGNGAFDLEADGAVIGSKTMPNTGAWQNWETISHTIQLNAGEQDLFIRATAGGWNINWFEFANVGGDDFILTLTTSGNGSVTKIPDMSAYPSGTSVTLTAVPGTDAAFDGWSGALSGTANPVTIVMDGNKSVTASFSGNGGGCDNPSVITTPFSFEGLGEQCWVTSDELGIINSWSVDKLEINGVDYTNAWANGGYPAKIDGKYYITFASTIPWGHFAASGFKSAGDDFRVSELTIYPNPANDVLFVELTELDMNANLVIVDMTGKQLISQEVYNTQMVIDLSALESGIYMLKVKDSVKRIMKN